MPTPGATRRNFVASGWTPFPPTRNCVCVDRGGIRPRLLVRPPHRLASPLPRPRIGSQRPANAVRSAEIPSTRIASMPRACRPPHAALLLLLLTSCGGRTPPPPPEVPVTVARAVRRDVPRIVDATGTVEPIQTATVGAQVDGILTRVEFREGDDVRAGQVLFRIDPRLFQAALRQAEGALARDQAHGGERHPRRRPVSRARREAVRDRPAARRRRGHRRGADGHGAGGQAAVEQARLNLQYATIRAPISGRAGGILLREGNLVRASAGTPLVVINQMAPILVRFAVPASLPRRDPSPGRPGAPGPRQPGGRRRGGRRRHARLRGQRGGHAHRHHPAQGASSPTGAARSGPGPWCAWCWSSTTERDALVVPLDRGGERPAGRTSCTWWIRRARRGSAPCRWRGTPTRWRCSSAGVEPGDHVVTDGQLRLHRRHPGADPERGDGGHGAVNISALFIHRPVMTTLVMAGILDLRPRRLPRPAGERPARPWTTPPSSVEREPPGRQPRDDGLLGGHAAREAVLHHRRARRRSPRPAARAARRSRCSSTLDRDIDAAAPDVQAAITQTLRQLPQGILPAVLPEGESVRRRRSSCYALTSDQPAAARTLDEYGETILAQRISTVDGVAQVQVYGSQKYAVRIQLDPQALAVRAASASTRWPRAVRRGQREPAHRHPLGHRPAPTPCEANGQLQRRGGVPRRSSWPTATARRCASSDLGRVIDGVQNNKAASWFNGERGIVLAIQRQPGTNTVEVAARVQAVDASGCGRSCRRRSR